VVCGCRGTDVSLDMTHSIRILALMMLVPALAVAQGRGQRGRGHQAPPSPPAHPQAPPSAPPRARPAQPAVGGGYIPQHGPPRGRGYLPPQQRSRPEPGARGGGTAPQARPDYRDEQNHPNAPHVALNGRWVGNPGHDAAHYGLARPWEHGHFPGGIGANHVWRLAGGGPNRFELGGYYFQIAPYDDPFCGDWLWDRDDIVLYVDYDNPGWYIAYNVRLGTYCHVMYLGY